MEIFTKSEAKCKKNNGACTLYEYPPAGSSYGMVVAEISGKYPDRGYCINMICKEIIYVIEGSGAIYQGDTERRFNKGDLIVIDKGEKFKWNAECVAAISCIPAWNPERYDVVMD